MHVGSWAHNMKHGVGWEIILTGPTRRKGEWKNNKLKRWLGKTDMYSKAVNKEDFYRPNKTQ